jgi:hypothetical protein
MKVGDMIRECDPTWTVADTKRARGCAQRMMDALNSWDQSVIRERMTEIRNEDQIFAAVVYTMLPAPIRNFLNENI